MREFRVPMFAFLLTVATFFSGALQAAERPNGTTCTPPGAWTSRAEFPSGVVRPWGTYFPANDKFYVLGGRSSDDAGSDFMQPSEYDPALDTWTLKAATFVDAQVNNMVGGVLNFGSTPSIVLVGGSAAGATTATADVRQYDPVADVLTTLSDDPWPGNADGTMLPGGAAVVDNKLYVFGGYDIGIGMSNTIYRFDPSAAPGSRWTLMTATLPNPLGYIPTAASNGMIYTLGGTIFVDATTLDDSTDVSGYDPVADTIVSLEPIPRATGETRAVTQTDGSIWVLGGGRVDPNPSNEVDVYSPAANAWSVGPAFITARRNFAADIDPVSGTVWATGGYDSQLPPDTVFYSVNEQFTPCTIDDTIFADGFDGPAV